MKHTLLVMVGLMGSLPCWSDVRISETPKFVGRHWLATVAYQAPNPAGDFTLQEFLAYEVPAKDVCLQLTAVQNQPVLEVYGGSCPKGSSLRDTQEMAFFAVADKDAWESKQNRVPLRKDGKRIGELDIDYTQTPPLVALKDLYCHPLFDRGGQPCDVDVRDHRYNGLSVNTEYTPSPSGPSAYDSQLTGFDADGKTHLCNQSAGPVSTEGSFFANACRYYGFASLICDGNVKHQCEANLGPVSLRIEADRIAPVRDQINRKLGGKFAVKEIQTTLYSADKTSMRTSIQPQATFWIDRAAAPTLKTKDLVAALVPLLKGLEVESKDGRKWKLDAFTILAGRK